MNTNSPVVTGVETDDAASRQAIDTLNLDLRESEERYRTLFDLVPVAVYAIDSTGVIQTFNRRAAELWGLSRRWEIPTNGSAARTSCFVPMAPSCPMRSAQWQKS